MSKHINSLIKQDFYSSIGSKQSNAWSPWFYAACGLFVLCLFRFLRNTNNNSQPKKKPEKKRTGPHVPEVKSIKLYLDHYASDLEKNNFEGAEKNLKSAFELCKDGLGPYSGVTAYTYFRLFHVYYRQGQYNKTEEVLKNTLEWLNKAPSVEQEELATIYENGAHLYYCIGNFDKSNEFCDKSAETYSMAYNSNDLVLGDALFSIAKIKKDIGKLEDAAELYEKSYKILCQHLKQGDKVLITVISDLSDVLIKQDKQPKAINFLLNEIKAAESVDKNLQDLYMKLVDTIESYSEAEIYKKIARAINTCSEPGLTVELLSELADIYWQMGKEDEARSTWDIMKKCIIQKAEPLPKAKSKYLQTVSFQLTRNLLLQSHTDSLSHSQQNEISTNEYNSLQLVTKFQQSQLQLDISVELKPSILGNVLEFQVSNIEQKQGIFQNQPKDTCFFVKVIEQQNKEEQALVEVKFPIKETLLESGTAPTWLELIINLYLDHTKQMKLGTHHQLLLHRANKTNII